MSAKGLPAMQPLIPLILIFSQILNFFERFYKRFQLLFAALHHKHVCLR